MFADLSSSVGNIAETWHQRHQVPQVSQKPVIAALTASSAWGRCPADLIRGGHGRASVSEDALRRNAAVAARLSSIRQS